MQGQRKSGYAKTARECKLWSFWGSSANPTWWGTPYYMLHIGPYWFQFNTRRRNGRILHVKILPFDDFMAGGAGGVSPALCGRVARFPLSQQGRLIFDPLTNWSERTYQDCSMCLERFNRILITQTLGE